MFFVQNIEKIGRKKTSAKSGEFLKVIRIFIIKSKILFQKSKLNHYQKINFEEKPRVELIYKDHQNVISFHRFAFTYRNAADEINITNKTLHKSNANFCL